MLNKQKEFFYLYNLFASAYSQKNEVNLAFKHMVA